ncbi:unnamed protein product, partial [Allacma fusca]
KEFDPAGVIEVLCDQCKVITGIVKSGSFYFCSIQCYISKQAGRPVSLSRAARNMIGTTLFSNHGNMIVIQYPNSNAQAVKLHNVFYKPKESENPRGEGNLTGNWELSPYELSPNE